MCPLREASITLYFDWLSIYVKTEFTLRNINVYTQMYMLVAIINEKRGHEFGREQGGLWEFLEGGKIEMM